MKFLKRHGFIEIHCLKYLTFFLAVIAAGVAQKSNVVVVGDNCLQQQQKLINFADMQDSEECDDSLDH